MQILQQNWMIYEFSTAMTVPATFATGLKPFSQIYSDPTEAHNNFIQTQTVERLLEFEICWAHSWGSPSDRLAELQSKVNSIDINSMTNVTADEILNKLKNTLGMTGYAYTIKIMEKISGLANGARPFSRTGHFYQSDANVSAMISSGTNFGGFTLSNSITI